MLIHWVDLAMSQVETVQVVATATTLLACAAAMVDTMVRLAIKNPSLIEAQFC